MNKSWILYSYFSCPLYICI